MTKFKQHHYCAELVWTGNKGVGTSSYRSYGRDYEVKSGNKSAISGSADTAFLGDAARYNPEELFLSSIASCHMLWYLHLCAEAGIVVTAYVDYPTAVMVELPDGSGKFEEVCLNPRVHIHKNSDKELATHLHKKANKFCFIANSLNLVVKHQAQIHLE